MPFEWAPGGILRQCPNSLIEPETWELFETWRIFRQYDALPYRGDAMDQPAPIFEAITVCEQAKADLEDKLRQEREREAERAKKKAAEAGANRRR